MTSESRVAPAHVRAFAALLAAATPVLGHGTAPGTARASSSSQSLTPPALESFRVEGARQLAVAAHDPQLEVGRIEGPVVLPETGRELWVASVLHDHKRRAVVALDAAGQSFDLKEARNCERYTAVKRYGRMSPQLAARVEQAPEGTFRVAAWLEVPDISAARLAHARALDELDQRGELTRELADSHLEQISEDVSARTRPVASAFAAELESLGLSASGVDDYAPLVFFETDLPRLTQIARDPRVMHIELAEGSYEVRQDYGYREIRADKLYALYPWLTAEAARVAIVEHENVCLDGPFDLVETRKHTTWGGGDHATRVAACVSSTDPAYPGVARGAKLYAASDAESEDDAFFTFGFQDSIDAISWAISKNCQILNLSYGAPEPGNLVAGFDRYLDFIARENARTLTIACGNSGAFAGDPGAGYNAIAVGAFDADLDYDWFAEPMYSASSWMNPTSGIETPQVVAPGVAMDLLHCWDGTSFESGTSYAAAFVAGTAAVVVDRQPALGEWPEAVRAIVMATAWHNIEGSKALSSKDGAGGISSSAAYQVARRGRGYGYEYGILEPDSFDSSNQYTAQTLWLAAGVPVRAVLSYDSQVGEASAIFGGMLYEWFGSWLEADLGLTCYGPSGYVLASSNSSLQPFQVIHFTPLESGWHTFKIRRWEFDGDAEFFATAVSTEWDSGE